MERCKFCQCEQLIRNGFVRRKQRYRCVACGKNQVVGDKRVKYTNATRQQALAMYLNSGGLRSIGRVLGVPFQLVSKWVADAGRVVEEEIMKLRMNPRHVSILEMDELFTYVQKNSGRYEYGWLLIGTEMRLLRLTSAAGHGKTRGNSTGKSTATR